MSIVHIVLIQPKADATEAQVQDLCRGFLNLKDTCIHPTSKTAYITSVRGGVNNNPEGLSFGLTHGFVVEFASEFDRKYYLEEDPVHRKFAESAMKILEQIKVVDFTPGVF